VATTKCTGLIKRCSNFGLLFCLTVAFVLKIFSFSDREEVLGDASTGIVGLQHAAAHMCQTGGPRAKCGPGSLNFKPQAT